MRENLGIDTKRLSSLKISPKDVAEGYKLIGKNLAEEYRLKIYEPVGENILLIDLGTYSGIEIIGIDYPEPIFRVIDGGLYYETVYGEPLGAVDDINKVYLKLVEKNKLNVDIFKEIFVCLVDYGKRVLKE